MTWPRIYDQIDPNWLRQKYLVECLNQSEIANLVGCTNNTIGRALDHHGIPRSRKILREGRPYHDPNWLRKMYHDRGLSTYEIGAIAGVCMDTIRHWMIKHHIDRRPIGHRPPKPWHDPDWLHQKYHTEQLSQREIAQLAGCTVLTIQKAMRRHGIPARQGRTAHKAERNQQPFQPPPSTLYIYRFDARPVFVKFSFNGRPPCPVLFDEVVEIPVIRAGDPPPKTRTRTVPVVLDWLDDLLWEAA